MNELLFDVTVQTGSIKMNSDELEQKLAAEMEKYKTKEFSEDTKKEAKADVAYLRKVIKAVSDRDKEVKKAIMAPYDEFHEGVNRLIAVIKEPIDLIDGQVKVFEEKRVKARREEIRKAYSEIVDESFADYIPLENIYGSKWTNATTSMKSIREELEDAAKKARNDIAVISAMNSDAVEMALNIYMNNRDLAGSIKYINDYEARKTEILKRQEEKLNEQAEKDRQTEIARIRQEERERIREEERIRQEAKNEAVNEIKSVDEKEAAPLSTRDSMKVIYTVVATSDEINEIEMALTSLGVYFERKDV